MEIVENERDLLEQANNVVTLEEWRSCNDATSI